MDATIQEKFEQAIDNKDWKTVTQIFNKLTGKKKRFKQTPVNQAFCESELPKQPLQPQAQSKSTSRPNHFDDFLNTMTSAEKAEVDKYAKSDRLEKEKKGEVVKDARPTQKEYNIRCSVCQKDFLIWENQLKALRSIDSEIKCNDCSCRS